MKKKLESEVSNMGNEKKEQILQNFNHFKGYLADKVKKGEILGMNDEQLAKTTTFIADYLSRHEEPRNREQYLLQELWDSGSKEEQHSLAHMLLKMVRQA
ncbi:hypothetical protein CSV63_11555 [Sporosarcina sp. P34]|uniref:DUF3243 domain-containing protein n=1 Tax=Sporosarcina sp. P34 TaxID=2048247 RepID=UPI000C1665B1|nr:DUF3243 domain-containing protein [Sporosarcina sp. P34]PID14787.1 hypothetical protein CSV63_11555 [Sporosarcina sp. P34]